MTLRALAWYRVKETDQYCQVAGIMSRSDPRVHVRTATETMSSFVVAVVWFTPSGNNPLAWTKRAIMLDLKKAFAVLREPLDDDLRVIRGLEKIANAIPFHSMSVDGEKTDPGGDP